LKDLYNKSLKAQKKDSGGTRRWRDFPWSWIRRINVVKMVILSEAVYRFSIIPIKTPMPLFTDS
jgi:hypothetical protein